MRIHLESNFRLLGSHNIDSIDLDCLEILVRDFLKAISDRSTKSPEYLTDDGSDVDGLFQVHVNGRLLDLCEDGVNTVLRDGDTVAICMNVLEGCCGGALQGQN